MVVFKVKEKITDEFETKVKRFNVTIISEDWAGELIILEEFTGRSQMMVKKAPLKPSNTILNKNFLWVTPN